MTSLLSESSGLLSYIVINLNAYDPNDASENCFMWKLS